MNGKKIFTLDDLRQNFVVADVLAWYEDGSLADWLDAGDCDVELEKVNDLAADDENLVKNLCTIFKCDDEAINAVIDAAYETYGKQGARLAKLQKVTSDEAILAKIDEAAFDQDELDKLCQAGGKEIYLVNEKFYIYPEYENVSYIGLGEAKAKIKSDEPVSLEDLGITLENIKVINPAKIKQKITENAANKNDNNTAAAQNLEWIRASLAVNGLIGHSPNGGDLRDALELFKDHYVDKYKYRLVEVAKNQYGGKAAIKKELEKL